MPTDRSFGAAALLALPFAAAIGVLTVFNPPSAAQHAASDPLVQLLGPRAPWLVLLAAVLAAIGWMRTAHIERADVLWAIAGAAAAIAVTLAVRGLVGPRLPAFIPPEESSAPGMALGLSAGLVEEIVFRLLILPAVYLLGRRKLLAAILAVVVSGALFSLSHELGPAGGVFDRRFMITRFVIPGAGMSLVALVRPSFMVTAHCTAHLTIPLLFR